MLHPREFAFGTDGIRVAQVISNHETQYGIAKELQRLIVKSTCLMLVPRRDLFVSPRAMSDCSLKQAAIVEAVSNDCLEKVEVWNRSVGVSQNTSDYNKRRKLV